MPFFVSIMHCLKKAYSEKDFSFIILNICLFLLPISVNLSTFTLITAITVKVIQIVFLNQRLFASKPLKYSSIIGLIFFAYIIISSFLQNGFSGTLEVYEKQFSHWILLFLIPILYRKKEDNEVLCYFFFLGVVFTCLYTLLLSFILNIEFNAEAFIKTVDIHHTYLSMYLLFFTNFLLIESKANYKDKRNLKVILNILLIALSFLIIFILKSKVSIVIFSILLLFHFVTSFSKSKILGYLIVLSILIGSIFLFNKKLNVSYRHALDFRLEIWEESLNLIRDRPIFGSLRASEKDLLNYKHYLSGKYYFMDSDLNSHNQYLSIIIKYGFFGVFILFFLALNMVISINKKTSKVTIKELIGFALIISIVFYIENILDRHHGIAFFTIFYNYFLVAVKNEDI